MEPKVIRSLFDYHKTMSEKLLDCIAQLTPDQFVQDTEYSVGSVRNHMVHSISGHQRWLAKLQAEPIPERLDYVDFPSIEATKTKWDQVEVDLLDYVNSLDESQLCDQMNYKVPHQHDADMVDYKNNFIWQILVHLVNHGTDHRSQVLSILNQFDTPTFEQDFIFYLWDDVK